MRGILLHCRISQRPKVGEYAPALIQHHAAEREIVIDGRNQAAASRFEWRLGCSCAALRIVEQIQRVRPAIEEIKGWHTANFFGRHVESRFSHPQRIEDAFAPERAETFPKPSPPRARSRKRVRGPKPRCYTAKAGMKLRF